MQALRFYGSFNVVVAGITIVNSSQCHLKFDNCQGVMVHDVTISSPENSLNTDGIHLQNSKDVSIHHTNLACGNSLIITVYLNSRGIWIIFMKLKSFAKLYNKDTFPSRTLNK